MVAAIEPSTEGDEFLLTAGVRVRGRLVAASSGAAIGSAALQSIPPIKNKVQEPLPPQQAQ